MKILKPFLFAALFITITAVSCKKDKKDPEPETPVNETGTMKLGFVNMVDNQALVFNQDYVNPKGDTFKVSKFNYYISNVILVKSDNSTYVEPNSYHLVKHSSPSTTLITIANVPKGTYKSVSFTLGVDSARNCSGAQDGDLSTSVAGDMFWTWSTGYIMFKLEGTAPKSGATAKILEYHIGGYGGVNKVQKAFSINFGGSTTVDLAASATKQINFKVDVNEFFKNPALIDFTTQYSQMSAG
ncbi:MAG: hypothetical protein K0S32_2335, partial [Bacteroidetes bacterium]|nr:hypothetical protein [Bacteroidota bacterium]